jgi:ubiquitin-protein ligase E3 C
MLRLLSSTVDPDLISDATNRISRNNSQMSTRERLWLLGNLIYLAKRASSMSFTAAVAHLLGSLADDVEFERRPEDVPNDVFDTEFLRAADAGFPLNTFLHQEITSLLDEHAVRNLLAGKGSSVTDATEVGLPRANAHALARYALTLLRCFPRRSDDLRMWLHLGPTNVDTISPTRYLWDASKQSQIFSDIWSTSRGVVQILKERTPATSRTEDWTIILVFLEMFSFDLKIMDDEEFMGNSPVRKRNSAVPVGDVGRLVTFLKHLGFTLYHDAAELNDMSSIPAQQTAAVTLQSRFRANATTVPDVSKPLTIADLPGLTTDYLKGLVTALLRAIYERDSRRGFLPKGHWLMTDRFDMRNFIGDVVHEEERRRQIHEDEDNEDDDVDDDDDDDEPDDLRNENSRSTASGHVRVLRAQQARARAQVKASKRRYMESVAPKLEILQNMPFIIPFNTRVETFRQFVHLDQVKRREGQVDPDQWRGMMLYPGNHARTVIARDLARHHAKIKRTQEFLDAYEQFYDLGADLKEPIQITFVDQWDMPEAGIDGGGVTKEFLTSVISQAFDQKVENTERFFIENDQHLLFPNPTAFDDLQVRYEQMGHDKDSSQIREAKRELYKQYEFLGRIIGKCLYEGILIDVSFAGFFLKKWALTGGAGSAPSESHYRPNLNDLLELDEGLYRGLLQVKNAADASELGMTFSVNDAIGPPGSQRIVEIDLIPNGSNIAVTNENRISYINRIASWRLQVQSQKQTRAFLRGLADMIPPSWLHMFNQSELQTLIGGAAAGIDVDDLRRNTHYGGTYVIGTDGLEHPSVRMFWDVMRKFPEDDRRKVLKFVTSTPRGPLLGFSHLHPKFSIRDSGRDANRYPTTSTCVNLLKLPMYESEDVLREKLLAAVNSGAGFDLS